MLLAPRAENLTAWLNWAVYPLVLVLAPPLLAVPSPSSRGGPVEGRHVELPAPLLLKPRARLRPRMRTRHVQSATTGPGLVALTAPTTKRSPAGCILRVLQRAGSATPDFIPYFLHLVPPAVTRLVQNLDRDH
ncbi:hypothetical protein DFH09DRAFT_1314128 [Mycena vulgaris]|nr:hypothetical protein DFH09DRAFT_1314128 [Mycena vulgaris]